MKPGNTRLASEHRLEQRTYGIGKCVKLAIASAIIDAIYFGALATAPGGLVRSAKPGVLPTD